jgi:hypothetical protein
LHPDLENSQAAEALRIEAELGNEGWMGEDKRNKELVVVEGVAPAK